MEINNRSLQNKLYIFSKNFLRTNQFECITQELSKSGYNKEKIELMQLGMMKRQFTAGIEWLETQEEELRQLIEGVNSKLASRVKEPNPVKTKRMKHTATNSKAKIPKLSKSKGSLVITAQLAPQDPEKDDQVAAQVIIKGEWQWILATVVKYHQKEDCWQVLDEDEQEQAFHYVKRKNILLLPRLRDIQSSFGEEKFEVGTKVLAVYPDTTSFYQATISGHSFISEGKEFCIVQFDADEDKDTGVVPHRNVPTRLIALFPVQP